MLDPDDLIKRYQKGASRIWDLFDKDPLGDSSAHFWIDRLEAMLDQDLIQPTNKPLKLANDLKSQGLNQSYHPG